MTKFMTKLTRIGAALAFFGAVGIASSAHAAKFELLNADDPGIGFNDPTPAAPVGINPGKTVGEQRRIAISFVASIWGRALGGNDTIAVVASFAPQECTATGGVLASAGPWTVNRDFANARFANTWYAAALANRLAKTDLDAAEGPNLPEIGVTSNGDLGKPGCIEGASWYYGLDDKAPAGSIDYVKTILHEFGHGLGFLSLADERDGTLFDGRPSIWEYYMYDNKIGKRWVDMTNAQRKASGTNNQFLAWTGFQTYIGAQNTLDDKNVMDLYLFDGFGIDVFASGATVFGPQPGSRSALGLIGILEDTRAPAPACNALTAAQVSQVKGKIAVVDRGGCNSSVKAVNLQTAGATGIIFVNITDQFGGRPLLGTPEPAVKIPSAYVSKRDGARLRQGGNRFATVSFFDARRPAGTDLFRRPLLFTPEVVLFGSSVSHFDIEATPNLLMEPFAEGDEATTLKPPRDLTLSLLKDIGW
jgi:hypothetical protein